MKSKVFKKVMIGSLTLLLSFSAISFVSASSTASVVSNPGTTLIKWDDFSQGFSEDKWFYFLQVLIQAMTEL
ncbi:hypothetical protein [Ferdinandcohnia sp. Marseille-Q9671]